jgi:TRAP-type C4-dicarboxylate transport system permease small subunit
MNVNSDFARLRGAALRADEHLATALMLLIVALISFQILVRGLPLNMETAWVAEVSRYMNVWIVFLLIARSSMEDKHIAVSYFFARGPQHFIYLVYLINLFVGVMIFIASINAMTAFSTMRTPAVGIPVAVLYIAGFIGGALFSAVQIYKLYAAARLWRR